MFFRVVGRLTSRFFRGLSKNSYNAWRSSRKHPISAMLVLLLVVGFGVLLYFTDVLGLTTGNFLGLGNGSGIATATKQQAEPDGRSTAFLTALKEGKANDLYDTLSDDFKASIKKRGVANAAQAQDFMNKRIQELAPNSATKLKYQFIHIVNIGFSDGSTNDEFNGTTDTINGKSQFGFQFTIKNGKIIDILSNEPITVSTLALDKSEAKDKPQPGVITRNMSSTAEQFMIGLTTFDADKVWNSLADSYKEQLGQQKISKDSMAKIFNEIKTINAEGAKTGQTFKYGGFAHAENINFPNGTSLDNFESVLSVNANATQPGYHIFLDANNKIIGIGSFNAEDRILAALLGRGQPTQ